MSAAPKMCDCGERLHLQLEAMELRSNARKWANHAKALEGSVQRARALVEAWRTMGMDTRADLLQAALDEGKG